MLRVTCAFALFAAPDGAAQRAARSTPDACAIAPERSSFVFRSGFWLNLHNFLHRAAKERRGIHDEVPAAMTVAAADTAHVRVLTSEESRVWEAALRVYVSDSLASGRADSIVQRLNERLATAAGDGDLRDVDIDPGVRDALRRAAPVYRAVWWPAHDRRNRDWIASLRALLGPREACLSRRVASAFAGSWPAAPVVVDASVYASWFGAYSTQRPLHITLSSNARGNQGSLGVETLLHETGHALTGPVDSALAATATRERRLLPRQLGHLLLFYTVGEVVREYVPAHVPYAEAFGIWDQSAPARGYRTLLEREWRPYLEGRTSFPDAITGIVRRLPRATLVDARP